MRGYKALLLLLATAAICIWVIPPGCSELRVQRAMFQLRSATAAERPAAEQAVVALGREAVPFLLRELSEPSAPDHEQLAALVREIDADFAARELRGDLGSPDATIRARAARVFGWLQLPESIDQLLALLEDPDEDVFRAATVSLVMLEARDALPTWRRSLVSGGASVRGICAYALGQLRDREALALLQRASLDSSAYVARESERAITLVQSTSTQATPIDQELGR